MRNFDFLFLFIIENTLFSPAFLSNVLSTFSILTQSCSSACTRWRRGLWAWPGARRWVQRQPCRKPYGIRAVFPTSSESSLCKTKVIICILSLLVFFGERDVGDGLGTSTLKPCLGVLSHKGLDFCWSMDLTQLILYTETQNLGEESGTQRRGAAGC